MRELISKEDYDKILDWHYDMEKEEDLMLVRPTALPLLPGGAAAVEADKETQEAHLKFSTGGQRLPCGQLICLIDVDGNVQPCSYSPSLRGM